MSRSYGFGRLPLIALAVVFLAAGCHSSQDQTAANQTAALDQASGPATANLAPVSTDAGSAAPATYSSQPTSNSGGNSDQDQGNYDPGYGQQAEYTDDQAPPALPDYNQPPDPGDGYLWTPGYWAWASGGYYWVPGVWTQAPYEGALWTPGYWGYSNNSYHFYRGYWGQYIGYYGGINYGNGYAGAGYQGGYWQGGHFNYNTTVNNVNVTVVHNVYSHPVTVITTNNHVSFNGGSGGVQLRARPAELVALHAPHVAPMTAQVQNQHAASTNKAQFAAVNHGRPATVAVTQPLPADRNVKPPPPLQVHNQPAPQPQQHPVAPQPQMHQVTPQPQTHTVAPPQRQSAPQPQAHPIAPQQHQVVQQSRPVAPQPHPAAPQPRPAAPPQRQAAPQPHSAAPPQRPAAPQHPVAPQHPAEDRPKSL
jgi:hypothetical protein